MSFKRDMWLDLVMRVAQGEKHCSFFGKYSGALLSHFYLKRLKH